MRAKRIQDSLLALVLAVLVTEPAAAASRAELPPFPNDLSPAGLRAAASQSADPSVFEGLLPEGALGEVQRFVTETRSMGLDHRSGRLTVSSSCPPNVRANDPTGDRIGETQSEAAIAVRGDTVVVGWNDSRGFLAGNTVSSYAYSTNAGATFTDGGNMPLALPTDQAFGDSGVDTDEAGNWYFNQIYTRAAGAPDPSAEQNIAVHHGRFNGGGVLVWDLPVQASIGTATTGNLDKCLVACDRATGNVYVAYTRFSSPPRIEIVRSTTLGSTWDPAIVLDADTSPTSSKQSARPFCGPTGEVYVVWEKFANFINCPDGFGNVANTTGVIGFARSLNFGASFDPKTNIGIVDHSWMWTGPGDLRERGNDFPDIAADRSGGPFNGRIYVTWHESAPWTANISAGPVVAEAADAANNNPGGAEPFSVGDNVTGSISSTTDFDYWTFGAAQGQNLLFVLDPQGFVCGISGTAAGMRMRLFATQSPYPNPTGFPDTLLAASALGTFEDRIQWTCPMTGSYLVRLQRSAGTTPFTYTLRVRNLAYGAPSPGRDARDVVLVRSSDRGLTWSAEQRLNDDPPGFENRRPFASVDGLGHAHVFWHDSRDAGFGSNAALTSIYGTTSRDGGVTWTPNYCVTDELSFFSFNTVAIPNLGDYNQAASAGGATYPAWTDQRISTGDVRTPGTNTYTAGLGPEVFTARVIYSFTSGCAADTTISAGQSAGRAFTIQNTGSVPDRYDYTITDAAGWISGGPVAGSTGALDPGESATIVVTVGVPSDCTPASDLLTFALAPTGDADGNQSCSSNVSCAPTVGVEGERVEVSRLESVGPSPTQGVAHIVYSLARAGYARLSIVDIQGREVAVLADGVRPAGRHEAEWNGRSEHGAERAGIYFVRYQVEGDQQIRHLVLMK